MKSLKKFILLLIIIGAAAYGGHYYYYNHYLQEDPAEIYQESLKYAQGIGVDKDESKSMELLVKAAKAGDVKAQVQLAWTLNQGVRTDKKSDKAAKWYAMAASQDNAEAQYMLGYMYENAIGVPKNDAFARDWFSKAANNGNQNAQLFLGVAYAKEKDFQNGYAWLNLASTSSNDTIRDKALQLRDSIAANMTPEEIQSAQSLTVEHGNFIRSEIARKKYEKLKWYEKVQHWINRYTSWF